MQNVTRNERLRRLVMRKDTNRTRFKKTEDGVVFKYFFEEIFWSLIDQSVKCITVSKLAKMF